MKIKFTGDQMLVLIDDECFKLIGPILRWINNYGTNGQEDG